MIYDKRFGATIEVEGTGVKFHTYNDWGLCIESSIYIQDPEHQTAYIEVPGSNRMLDVSNILTDHPTFKKRKISFKLGGENPVVDEDTGIPNRNQWDRTISKFRNIVEGRVVKVTFDNDQDYYWYGRAHITEYNRINNYGTFVFSLPDADPYKYKINQANEGWLWDSFSFIDGVIKEPTKYRIDGQTTVVVPAGNMPVTPTINAELDAYIDESGVVIYTAMTIQFETYKYGLVVGENYFPQITVNGDRDVTLIFNGQGNVSINYREGSL